MVFLFTQGAQTEFSQYILPFIDCIYSEIVKLSELCLFTLGRNFISGKTLLAALFTHSDNLASSSNFF